MEGFVLSGPKIDYAELERLQRERLERERLEKIAKIRRATDNYYNEVSKAEGFVIKINNDNRDVIDSLRNESDIQFILDNIYKIKRKYVSMLRGSKSEKVPEDLETIENLTRNFSQKMSSIFEQYKAEVEPHIEELARFGSIGERVAAIKNASLYIDNQNGEYTIEELIFNSEKLAKNEEILKAAHMVEDEILMNMNSDYISEKDRAKLNLFLSELTEFSAGSVKDIKEVLNNYLVIKNSVKKNMENFEDAYREYTATYLEYSETTGNSENTEMLKPEQFMSVEEIEKETERLSRASSTTVEQRYIKEQIDAVMEEMGYGLCNSIVFDECPKGNHYLCDSKVSNDAIHIYISENNIIMMEVVESEEEYRKDSFNVNAKLTGSADLEEEIREKMFDLQGQFCKMHPEIVKKLKERGVVLNEKEHKLPSIKHSKKIKKFVSQKAIIDKNKEISAKRNALLEEEAK